MKLSGKQVQQIQDALLSGYGSETDLAMMVRVQLDENLSEIAGGENLKAIVFKLVRWAEQEGRVGDLITGAQQYNPGNPDLRRLAQAYAPWQASATPEQPGAAPATARETYPPRKDASVDRSPAGQGLPSGRRWAIVAAIVAAVILVAGGYWVFSRQIGSQSTLPGGGTAALTPTTALTATVASAVTTEPATAALPTPTATVPAVPPTATVDLAAARRHLQAGQAALASRDWTLAVQECGESVALNPDEAQAHYCLGFAHNQLDQNELAIEQYGEAIRLDPTNYTALLERGLLYANVMDDCEKAMPDLEKYLQNPSAGYVEEAQAALAQCRP